MTKYFNLVEGMSSAFESIFISISELPFHQSDLYVYVPHLLVLDIVLLGEVLCDLIVKQGVPGSVVHDL